MSTKSILAVVGLASIVGTIAFAQPAHESKPQPAKDHKPSAAQPEHGMPKMTEQQMKDMQMCMEAATPGEQHAHLIKGVGQWAGKTKMWMSPDQPPMESECTSTVTSIMDGRYIKIEVNGDMGEMGKFSGMGINGYDNVSKQYVSTWCDSMSTGIMNGTGELSSDGKVMTWTMNYNCPINKKPTTMRQVETQTGPDSFTLEMFGADPHTGKEMKMMEIKFKRQGPAAKAVN